MPSHHRLSSDSHRQFSLAKTQPRRLRTAGRAAVLRVPPAHLLQPLAQVGTPLEPPWRNWSRAGPRKMEPHVHPVCSKCTRKDFKSPAKVHGHPGKPFRGCRQACGAPRWAFRSAGKAPGSPPQGPPRRPGGPRPGSPPPAKRADGRPSQGTTARGGKRLQDYRYRLLTWPHVLLRAGTGWLQGSMLCCQRMHWFPSGSTSYSISYWVSSAAFML